MASKDKSDPSSHRRELIVDLIESTTSALVRLLTAGTSTLVALGILVILAVVILKANPEQQQIVPWLTGMLGVIIGQMLSQKGSPPPEPPEPPGSSD